MLTPRERLVTKTHRLEYKNAVIRLLQGGLLRTRCRRYSKHLQKTLLKECSRTKIKSFLDSRRYQGVNRRNWRYFGNIAKASIDAKGPQGEAREAGNGSCRVRCFVGYTGNEPVQGILSRTKGGP